MCSQMLIAALAIHKPLYKAGLGNLQLQSHKRLFNPSQVAHMEILFFFPHLTRAKLAIDSKPKQEKSQRKISNLMCVERFVLFIAIAAKFEYQIIINSPLQNSHLVVKHINGCSFRHISYVVGLIKT